MNRGIYFFLSVLTCSVLLVSCFGNQENTTGDSSSGETQLNKFQEFEEGNHFKSQMSKAKFDSLQGWDFAWAVIDPVLVMIESTPFELQRVKRLDAGQKALYFFLKTDEQVKHGGFIKFYWNGYEGYIPPLKDGLELVGDKEMLALVLEADNYYKKNKEAFENADDVEAFNALYDQCPAFKKLSEKYMQLRDKSITHIEKYAKGNSDQFVVLK